MKFVSITSDEVKEALLEGNRISIHIHTYNEIRYAVDNPSDVDEHFKYDSDSEKMFFGYINKGKKNKYVFLLMQYIYSSNTEICLDNLVGLISALTTEVKQKSLKIKDLESEIENYITEQALDEIDKFNDSLTEDTDNSKLVAPIDNSKLVAPIDNSKLVAPISCQVKLPSQKSYITVDNFDMFT